MAVRIASGAVGLPLLALSIWADPVWFSAVVAIAAAIGAIEVCGLAQRRGRSPMARFAALWAVALVTGSHIIASNSDQPAAGLAIAAAGGFALMAGLTSSPWLALRGGLRAGLADWSVTNGAILYPGALLSFAPHLRALDQGAEWVFFVIFVTFASDTAAYLVGRSLGRRPMAPRVSPRKTWEGGLGGLAGSAAAAVGLAALFGLDISWFLALALGLLMGVVGQLGDLAESALKRAAGAKDSGRLIPGHGGILDRLDSIVWNIPLLYYCVIWIVL